MIEKRLFDLIDLTDFFGLEMNLPYQGYEGQKEFYLYEVDLYWLTHLIGLITVILFGLVLSKRQ